METAAAIYNERGEEVPDLIISLIDREVGWY